MTKLTTKKIEDDVYEVRLGELVLGTVQRNGTREWVATPHFGNVFVRETRQQALVELEQHSQKPRPERRLIRR